MLIAVDGTAASGKGTLSKGLADALHLAYLDTGSLYRAVALSLLRQGVTTATLDETTAEAAAHNLDLSLTIDPELRSPATSEMAAGCAAIPRVRAVLLARQRAFAADIPAGKKGAILDGRDIGTVVLPHAGIKFFVDAEPAIRAERRYKELIDQGYKADLADIEATLKERDARDMNRATAPLKQADDAIFIDTSSKSVKDMLDFALEAIKAKGAAPEGATG